MKRFRYWLSSVLITKGIDLIPDKGVKALMITYTLAAVEDMQDQVDAQSEG